jgi:hypothetical protein
MYLFILLLYIEAYPFFYWNNIKLLWRFWFNAFPDAKNFDQMHGLAQTCMWSEVVLVALK